MSPPASGHRTPKSRPARGPQDPLGRASRKTPTPGVSAGSGQVWCESRWVNADEQGLPSQQRQIAGVEVAPGDRSGAWRV